MGLSLDVCGAFSSQYLPMEVPLILGGVGWEGIFPEGLLRKVLATLCLDCRI